MHVLLHRLPSPAALLHDLHDLLGWPQASQEQARRNAMVAATACAQRRVERQEVDDYLASLAALPPAAEDRAAAR